MFGVFTNRNTQVDLQFSDGRSRYVSAAQSGLGLQDSSIQLFSAISPVFKGQIPASLTAIDPDTKLEKQISFDEK
jgi:hypothetical protein